MDAAPPDPRASVAVGVPIGFHDRFVRTAGRLRADDDPQELLGAVVRGLFDLDLGQDRDRVSLDLASDHGVEVVAVLPSTRPRTSSATAREAIESGAVVVREDADGRVVAVPVVRGGACRGALVLRRPPGTPPVATAELEAAAALLAGATGTVRGLEGQRTLDVARADFVARVSHELRTPLTIISGFAATLGLQGEVLSEDERHAMLDRIVTAAVRLEHLVEELLTLASVELGHRAPVPADCVVRDVVDLVVRDQGGAERVEVDCPAHLRVVTDPILARLVLGPVVENALHHGTSVWIGAVSVSGGVRVSVQDDGPGVPPELGDRIFDRFVRGDDRLPGLGLGLATARQIGHVVGARLSLEEVEVGTRMRIDLPDLTATG